jgi:hypothetical protein
VTRGATGDGGACSAADDALAFFHPSAVSKWSCLSTAGGTPPRGYPAGRVVTPASTSADTSFFFAASPTQQLRRRGDAHASSEPPRRAQLVAAKDGPPPSSNSHDIHALLSSAKQEMSGLLVNLDLMEVSAPLPPYQGEREGTWWTHTGGGKALAFKPLLCHGLGWEAP